MKISNLQLERKDGKGEREKKKNFFIWIEEFGGDTAYIPNRKCHNIHFEFFPLKKKFFTLQSRVSLDARKINKNQKKKYVTIAIVYCLFFDHISVLGSINTGGGLSNNDY